MSVSSDFAPLGGHRFLDGLVCAGSAQLIATLLARWRHLRAPSTTLVAAAGVLLAATRWFQAPPGLAFSVAVMALGARLGTEGLRRFVTVAPGALLLATVAGLPGPWWARWIACGGAWLAGAGAPEIDRLCPRVGPLLLAGSVATAYFTVPDTERALLVVGGGATVAIFGVLLPGQRLGCGAAAMAGLMAWAVTFGAVGRPSTVVGATASLGLLLVGPIVVRLDRLSWFGPPLAGVGAMALLGGQFAVDVVASSVIGRSPTLASAVVRAAVMMAVVVGLLVVLGRKPRVHR